VKSQQRSRLKKRLVSASSGIRYDKNTPFMEFGELTPTILVTLTGSSTRAHGDLSRRGVGLIANRMPSQLCGMTPL
jgi:hypothetical protein